MSMSNAAAGENSQKLENQRQIFLKNIFYYIKYLKSLDFCSQNFYL